jgi:hypothetical protein
MRVSIIWLWGVKQSAGKPLRVETVTVERWLDNKLKSLRRRQS